MGVARTVYIRRAVSCILFSSFLYATSCILFRISTLSLFPRFPPFLHLSNTRPALPIPIEHVCRTLSVSLLDTYLRCCPSLCVTHPSDAVHICTTGPSDIVHLCSTCLFDAIRLYRHIRKKILCPDAQAASRRTRRSECSRRTLAGHIPLPMRNAQAM